MTVQSDSLRVVRGGSRAVASVILSLAGAYLLAISSHMRVSLPFSPVPVTGQTLVVLLLGGLLGAHRGMLSVGLYLAGGVLGLPLFAGGSMAGPTGGYLVGFAVAATLVGRLVESGWARRPLMLVAALLLGNVTIYLFGLPWLAGFVGWRAVLPLGLYPFLLGDSLKLGCAACVLITSERRADRALTALDPVGGPRSR